MRWGKVGMQTDTGAGQAGLGERGGGGGQTLPWRSKHHFGLQKKPESKAGQHGGPHSMAMAFMPSEMFTVVPRPPPLHSLTPCIVVEIWEGRLGGLSLCGASPLLHAI